MANLKSLFFAIGCMAVLGACGPSEQEQKLLIGEEIVRKNCKVCHAQGINGAPIIGNLKMWGPRIGRGLDALAENAINGVGLMPAKGGKSQLSDEQIKLAVNYLLHSLEQ